ncbi:hypothetical protein KL905_001153 [Ogataea polymorpha]|nr:hypothetical protein KL907_000429 [Ogataea polymorpha]KAG7922887.1 hypothetical protein KL905_001153 [Ogataea polymorpha]
MAKKISKHSRAARRGEISETTGEARDLERVPRLEKTDTIGPMIRASASKNEDLLRQKMEKKASKSNKSRSGISKTIKTRREKAVIIDGKLGSKIEASINRAKEIQSMRKANWDTINKQAKEAVKSKLLYHDSSYQTEGRKEATEDDSEWENMDEEEESNDLVSSNNRFALLEEVEA